MSIRMRFVCVMLLGIPGRMLEEIGVWWGGGGVGGWGGGCQSMRNGQDSLWRCGNNGARRSTDVSEPPGQLNELGVVGKNPGRNP